MHLAFEINDLISPQHAIVVQDRPASLVMRGKFANTWLSVTPGLNGSMTVDNAVVPLQQPERSPPLRA
jgi:hypothetical protein